MKRVVVILVVLAMLLSFMGCQKDQNTPNDNGANKNTDKNVNENVKNDEEKNESEKEQEQEEPTPISIFQADGGRVIDEDNLGIAEFEKELNIDLSIELIPGDQFAQKSNIIIASGNLPDIMRLQGYDIFNYVDQDIFAPLNDLIDNYGANIKKHVMEKTWEKVSIDGTYYCIPSANYTGKYGQIARKDVMEKVGATVPKTTDEMKEFLNKLSDEMIPFTGANGGNPRVAFMPFFGAFGGQFEYTKLVDDKMITFDISDDYKESLEYIKSLYDEELIDKEIFILEGTQTDEKIVQSKAASISGWWSMAPVVYPTKLKMNEINPDASFELIPPVVGPNGESGMRANTLVNYTACISKDCEVKEEAIKFLDYLISDEGAKIAYWGIEGIDYTYEGSSNMFTRTEEGSEKFADKTLDPLHQLVFRADLVMPWIAQEDELKKYFMMSINELDKYSDAFEGISTEDYATYYQEIKKFTDDMFVQFITGEKSIENDFDNYVSEWKQRGGEIMRQSQLDRYNSLKGTNYVFGN